MPLLKIIFLKQPLPISKTKYTMNKQFLLNKSALPKLKDSGKPNKMDGYPLYPEKEDIYMQDEAVELAPEDIAQFKLTPNFYAHHPNNELDFQDLVTGEDLDVPGSEMDDANEMIGSEDEENNYYSLGGDNHLDLDENYPYNN